VTESGDRGSVTAELAVALPVVVLLIAVIAAAGSVGRARWACQDAAWTAARLVARGDAVSRAVAEATELAPPAAAIDVGVDDLGRTVSVRVRADVPVAIARVATVPLGCAATAPLEEGSGWLGR
jgi:Flp pilus assembly protein TadG